MKTNPFKMIKPFMAKHEPEILMATGIGGLVFSTIWGIRASFKASEAINKYKEEKQRDKLTTKETFKLTWKLYLPVVVSTAASIPCIVMSNHVSNKRYAALATAYTVSETALQEYKDKIVEKFGEDKAQEVNKEVTQDKITTTYSPNGTQIIMTGNGDQLFYEPLSGRYFKSSWSKIEKAANNLNSDALSGMENEITLNDWFDALGLEPTEAGEILGWNLLNSPKNLIDISMSSHVTSDNIPCGSIYYNKQPVTLR
jgi:hypothetical protein